MTRFQLSSFSNYGPPDYGTPPSSTPRTPDSSGGFGGNRSGNSNAVSLYSRVSGQQSRHGATTSVRLVTCSPDGQSMYSLIKSDSNNTYIIETHRLPIIASDDRSTSAERRQENNSEQEHPPVIRTQLPDEVLGALQIDPPVELICVDAEISSLSARKSGQERTLPRLCLYTRQNAFLLQLGYDSTIIAASTFGGSGINTRYGSVVQGHVISCTEPFERYLPTGEQKTIIRIRPAPQRCADYITIVPDTSMAALIFNKDTNEYSILLHHSSGTITVPAEWRGPEEVLDSTEAIVDFCFSRSSGLAIFPSMTILLLKASGELMAASPIVFDGAVVAKSFIQEGLDYLQAVKQVLSDRNCPKYRQCKAAEQYLIDVFGFTRASSNSRGASFCSTRILTQKSDESAAVWPVSIQGPVLIQNIDENVRSSSAIAIETFGSTDHFAGIAIGRTTYEVDFIAISPTNMLPRFAFESLADMYDLNNEQYKLGSIIERVGLVGDQMDDYVIDGAQISLIRDPIASNILHFVTSSTGCSISTNAMKMMSRKLSGETIHDPIRTTAWSCLSSSSLSRAAIIGAFVSNDINMGHDFIARLADGTIEQINITRTQYLHELEGVLKDDKTLRMITDSVIPRESEFSTLPLHEKIQPSFISITAGLSNMSKIVGTHTSYKDITPDALAVAISLKERCDKEVVVPLLELRKIVDSRRQQLKYEVDSQKKQLHVLNKSINNMRDKMNKLNDQVEKANENAMALSERSKAVLQASNDLLPTVTKAEFEYFQDMKRLDLKVTALQNKIQKLNAAAQARCQSLNEDYIMEKLGQTNHSQLENANKILNGERLLLDSARKLLNQKEEQMKEIQKNVGLAA